MNEHAEENTIVAATGHRFAMPALLRQALTHRSYSAAHNERLEFLGDGVLNCTIAEALFAQFPELPEGDLSRVRAHLVNQKTLSEIAQDIHLGEQLLLGEGELRSGGAQRPSILADALEALIGAIFMDAGYGAARATVQKLFASRLVDIDPTTLGKDGKTLLQEFLQARRLPLPQYTVSAIIGEAHEQLFRVVCEVPALSIRTEGEGSNRRSAEQNAAARAYEIAAKNIVAA